MGKVQGIKERLHSPIYDAFFVDPAHPPTNGGPWTFRDAVAAIDPRVIRYFVDVQNKTRLETNLQAAGQLPSLNAFEARAMRVVTTSPSEQDRSDFLAGLIYNSVTSLIVGEKTMIEMPTFYFPGGAGVSPGNGTAANHGEPDPMATFRFSEPVTIEPQQNFRVEMLFPRGIDDDNWSKAKGPLRIWVVLDGYLTRDVQ